MGSQLLEAERVASAFFPAPSLAVTSRGGVSTEVVVNSSRAAAGAQSQHQLTEERAELNVDDSI